MIMQFKFDDDKIKQYSYSKEKLNQFLDKHFLVRSSIVKVEEGLYKGTMKDFDVFSQTVWFPENSWFLKIIKEWYWCVHCDDINDLSDREDCLKTYYKVKNRNK